MHSALRIFLPMFKVIFWLTVTFLISLLIKNTLPYFNGSLDHPFLQEKNFAVGGSFWLIAFYLHIAASMLCLLAAFSQFSSTVLKRYRPLHVVSGRVYGYAVLLIAGPTGLYLSFFAKGGFLGFLGFFLLGLFWIFSTYKGIDQARKGNILSHKKWMARSYALALTAISFRVIHIIHFYLGFDPETNYVLSLWMSNLLNILIVEFFIQKKYEQHLTPKPTI